MQGSNSRLQTFSGLFTGLRLKQAGRDSIRDVTREENVRCRIAAAEEPLPLEWPALLRLLLTVREKSQLRAEGVA
jgi:hypothetical protein